MKYKKVIMVFCQRKVKKALREGVLHKTPCYFCGSIKRLSAHHIDYRHPLEVIWMCQGCHAKYHFKLKRIRSAFGIPTYDGQYLLLANMLESHQDLLDEKDNTFNELIKRGKIRGIFLPLERPLIAV